MKEPSRYTQDATGTIRQRQGYGRRVGASLHVPRPCHHPGRGRPKKTSPAIAERDGVTEGLICVISIVEPAWSFDVGPTQHPLARGPPSSAQVRAPLPLLGRRRVRLHAHLYPVMAAIPHPDLGNGREWLARQLDAAGVGYVRHENAFLRIDNLHTASDLCERFAHRAWPRLLDAFARRVNPLLTSSKRPTLAATTGSSTRPRSPPTSCSPTGCPSGDLA